MIKDYAIKEYVIYTVKNILGINDDKSKKKTAEYHDPCTWCCHCFYDEEHYPYWFCKYDRIHEVTGKYKPCCGYCAYKKKYL